MAPDQDRSAPTGNLIREYLLGRLDDQDELEKSLSKEILSDDDLAEIVAATEDEIIEDYLDGTLSGPDREAVDKYFLRPPERGQKLLFARLLRQRFQAGSPDVAGGNSGTGTGLAPAPVSVAGHGIMFHLRCHVRTYCELAALLILSASTFIYMVRVSQVQSQIEAERKNQRLLEGELAQEHEAAASLARQLHELHPAVVLMSFSLGKNRGSSAGKPIEINSSTQEIHVEFVLKDVSAATYDVQLMSGSQTPVWSETGLYPSSGTLSFQVPVQGITTGDYRLIVTPQPQNNSGTYSFSFHAEVAK